MLLVPLDILLTLSNQVKSAWFIYFFTVAFYLIGILHNLLRVRLKSSVFKNLGDLHKV